MFVDYYDILGIDETADLKAIKSAYKCEALKWHPDKNKERDTTQRMQLINAARFILSDIEARKLYDIEYKRFKASGLQKRQFNKETDNSYKERYTYDFNIENEQLSRWMNNAMKQGLDLLKNTYSMTSGGIKEATKGALQLIIFQIVVVLIIILVCVIVGITKFF